MTARLSVVHDMPPARTLFEMAGGNAEQVASVLRSKIGTRAVRIAARNFYVFDDSELTEASVGECVNDTGMVSGVFQSVETVETMVASRRREQLALVSEAERQLAIFATQMHWRFSEEQSARMAANDTSIASAHQLVGVALDESVEFFRMKSEKAILDEESRLGFKLHAVPVSA